MARRIELYPHRGLIKCGACGHVSTGSTTDYPPKGTPPEKIRIEMGTRRASMYCSNPSCHCFTVYGPSPLAVELLTEKYKSKNP